MRSWSIEAGAGPVVATAIHAGHAMRPELEALSGLSPEQRRREEDPHTERWTEAGDHRVVVHTSRFEVDMNRPRETCVYLSPEDAWGLSVWRERPSDDLVASCRALHEAFYDEVRRVVAGVVAEHGAALVLDVHSYNHHRGGPEAPFDDPELNPDVNLGTGSMDRERWGPVADAFLSGFSGECATLGVLDVRENVKFRGGQLSRFVHAEFPGTACALAVEFKKTFMDEWSGEVDAARLDALVARLVDLTPELAQLTLGAVAR